MESSKQEILNHIDTIATADVEACTEAAVTKIAQIDSSIAMVGFAKYGLSTAALLDGLIAGYQSVVTKLAPTCGDSTIREYDSMGRPVTVEITNTCVAYNGDRASQTELYCLGRLRGPAIDRAQVSKEATRDTSRWVAQNALPGLQSARAGR
ncbi:hypothetical protein [Phytohabitans suffuscus]|uniref:hypothetical protein n=1 Tax=Phytohabitans suffuscus TaxID=624315 RepID=UPI001566C6DF|nr:hypothetical protein [Phytohabitans suffuscus]